MQRNWKDKYMQKILFPYDKLNYFKGRHTNEPILGKTNVNI